MNWLSDIRLGWAAAHRGLLYVVVKEPEKILYLESPEFQGLSQGEPQYDLARVFFRVSDVSDYLLALETICKVDLVWECVSLKRLWQLLRRTDGGTDRPIRLVLNGESSKDVIETFWVHDCKRNAA